MARYVAKNIVKAGLADRFELQVSYAIGKAEPTSLSVETFGTGRIGDDKISSLIQRVILICARPLSFVIWVCGGPSSSQVAAYGHFGREDVDAALGKD